MGQKIKKTSNRLYAIQFARTTFQLVKELQDKEKLSNNNSHPLNVHIRDKYNIIKLKRKNKGLKNDQ